LGFKIQKKKRDKKKMRLCPIKRAFSTKRTGAKVNARRDACLCGDFPSGKI
jgi:hypothetical protein